MAARSFPGRLRGHGHRVDGETLLIASAGLSEANPTAVSLQANPPALRFIDIVEIAQVPRKRRSQRSSWIDLSVLSLVNSSAGIATPRPVKRPFGGKPR
jgi:hypothetical protein